MARSISEFKSSGLSVVYMNRRCPRNCPQCSTNEADSTKTIRSVSKWAKIFRFLNLLSDFTIVLGSEPWTFMSDLPRIITRQSAVYTSVLTKRFMPMSSSTFEILSRLKNFSAGYDYPGSQLGGDQTDVNKIKARDAYLCMKEIRSRSDLNDVELYMSCTIHAKNFGLVEQIYEDAKELNAFLSFNFINYDVDGGFDFFPAREDLGVDVVSERQFNYVRDFVRSVEDKSIFYIWETFEEFSFKQMTRMKWHCDGNPYDGPTIDHDGSLRVCGYRKGKHTPQITIEQLQSDLGRKEWREAVHKDAQECPGCSWSCPMSYHIRGVREHDRSTETSKG